MSKVSSLKNDILKPVTSNLKLSINYVKTLLYNHSTQYSMTLERKIITTIGTLLLITSCTTLETDKTTPSGYTSEQPTETRKEHTPFYALETIVHLPKARTGTRGEIPILAESEEIDYLPEGLPIFRKKSLTLIDEEYHVNIDLLQQQTFGTLEGTYVLTFYTFNDDSSDQSIPQIMYKIITDIEGNPLRANYQYFQQPTFNIEIDDNTKTKNIDVLPTSIIIHQNPFQSAYGTSPEDGIVTFTTIKDPALSEDSWIEEKFSPRDEKNPVSYNEAQKMLEREKQTLHITSESCKKVLTTAQQILEEEWTLEEYLARE